jgi:ectoine hydroxylase-related dioxygenase (phytanoyl-CoA dioxygenase family)
VVFRKLAKKILKKSPSLYSSLHTINFEQTHQQDISLLNENEKKLFQKVNDVGYVVLENFFDSDFCKKCITDFEWMLKNKKEFVQHSQDYRIFGAEHLSDNINQFSNQEFITRFANAYMGVPTCNGFTLAAKLENNEQEFGSGGTWHRDSYFRQFKSIIYLDDVDEGNGPFQVVANSHKTKQKSIDKKLANFKELDSSFTSKQIDILLNRDPERLHTLTGKAGTVILVDTSILHRGKPLQNGIRYSMFNYYFERTQINSHLVEHFSPLVSPEKVLRMALS